MDTLNLKELLKIVDSWWKENDPIKQFIRDQGFNPDNGDFLLLPLDFEPKIEHPNVKYHRFVECPCLIRSVGRYVSLEEVIRPDIPRILLFTGSCT